MSNKYRGSYHKAAGLLVAMAETLANRGEKQEGLALIDHRIVWYGSSNLLGFGSGEESIMRLEIPNIAKELIKSIEK